MEIKGLQRLEGSVDALAGRLGEAAKRQGQLSAALVKSREEIDRLEAELERYRSERVDTKKKVDALLKRFDTLSVDWEAAES
jgi:chromosome segregation ATPase